MFQNPLAASGLALAFDLGTGGCRVGACDVSTGAFVGKDVSLPWKTYADTAGGGDIVMFAGAGLRTIMQTIEDWMKINQSIVDDTKRPLCVISIGGHMHAPVIVEGSGVVLPVEMWNSAHATDAGKHLTFMTGHKIDRRLTISHLYQRVVTDLTDGQFNLDAVLKVTTFSGYFASHLTGKFGLGPTEYSGLGFNHPNDGELDIALFNHFGDHAATVRSWLPVQLKPWQLLAKSLQPIITRNFPEHWRKAIVAGPEGDQGMGRLALCRGRKDVGLVLGSSIVFTSVGKWGDGFVDRTNTVDFFTDPLGDPLRMALITAGMREADQYVAMRREQYSGVSDIFRHLGEIAEAEFAESMKAEPGFQFSVRDPGLGVDKPFDLHMSKAIELESKSVSSAWVWNSYLNQIAASIRMRGQQLWGDNPPEQLILGGAAAKDNVLAQRIADMTGIAVLRPDGADMAMLNGAMVQGRAQLAMHLEGLGSDDAMNDVRFRELVAEFQPAQTGKRFEPNSERRAVLDRYFEQFTQAIAEHGKA